MSFSIWPLMFACGGGLVTHEREAGTEGSNPIGRPDWRPDHNSGDSGWTDTGETGDPDTDTTTGDPTQWDEGWTELTPSDDSQMLYVSSSEGDDSNPGTIDEPLATVQSAWDQVRDGYPDWVLLKRGDAFYGKLGDFTKSGRSEDEKLVITAYGEGERPEIRLGEDRWINVTDDDHSVAHIAITSIALRAVNRDPDDAAFDGGEAELTAIRTCCTADIQDWLLEDMSFRYFTKAMTVEGDVRDITIRRSFFLDSYSIDAGHSQGIYTSDTTNLTFEENIFDHNGWNETIEGADPTKFNHNIYIQSDNTNVEARGNIIARAAAHGAQFRPGAIVEDNIFLDNNLAFFISGPSHLSPDDVEQKALNNVVVGCAMKDIDGGAGFGIQMWDLGKNALAEGNIVAQCPKGNSAKALEVADHILVDNVIYDWGGLTDPSDYVPTEARNAATYNASLGGEESIEGYLEALRQQRKGAWDIAYSPGALHTYLLEGWAE